MHARPKRTTSTARSYPTYFAFGAIALHLVFIVIPSVMGIYYSLTNWSRFSSDTEFVGLDNYRTVFGDRGAMLQAVKNTVLFTGLTIITKTVIGLMLALLVSRGIRRFATVHRAVIYLPVGAADDRRRDRLQVDPQSIDRNLEPVPRRGRSRLPAPRAG